MKIKFQIKLDIPLKRRWGIVKLSRNAKKREGRLGPIENTGRDAFYKHLLQQEVDMWYSHPETFSANDWDFIVRRRGFNIQEQHSLLLFLWKIGFDVTHCQLYDKNQKVEQIVSILEADYKKDRWKRWFTRLDNWVPTKSYEKEVVSSDVAIGNIEGVNIYK